MLAGSKRGQNAKWVQKRGLPRDLGTQKSPGTRAFSMVRVVITDSAAIDYIPEIEKEYTVKWHYKGFFERITNTRQPLEGIFQGPCRIPGFRIATDPFLNS